METSFTAIMWLQQHRSEVESMINEGKVAGFHGRNLDQYLLELLSPMMRKSGVRAEFLPICVDDLIKLRSRVGIQFPRGRVLGQSLDAGLAKAGDVENRAFLAHIPGEMKEAAFFKAEKEVTRLIEAIQQIFVRFPELDKNISREELALALSCVLNGASRTELANAFTLRILRKANLDMCEQVARTRLID